MDNYDLETSTYLPQMALDTLAGTDNYITSSQYDSAGRLRSQIFGNGVTQTHTYNNWNTSGGRLATIAAGSLQNLSYSYDTVGNIQSITDTLAGPQLMQSGNQGCQDSVNPV